MAPVGTCCQHDCWDVLGACQESEVPNVASKLIVELRHVIIRTSREYQTNASDLEFGPSALHCLLFTVLIHVQT